MKRPSNQLCPHCKGTGYASEKGANLDTLIKTISNLSEDYYAAGWLMDCEHDLWGMLQGKTRRWGLGVVPDSRIDDLKILAHEVQQWPAWQNGEGPRGVPLLDWVALDDLFQLLSWIRGGQIEPWE